ncbi:MAG: ImmA/IrrE family metallo-endopeptidase [Gemmataceae bacterium]
MATTVPYMTKESIETEASLLLAEYAEQFEAVTKPPVPVDDIIELHLKLALEIKDLREVFNFGDVHGAIWFRLQKVGVDQSLDPNQNPSKRGRYHFTLAHEAGHWRLHRKYFLQRTDQKALFETPDEKPDYVCRSSQRKLPVEWQADQFAANLLMPRTLINQAWLEWKGTMDSMVLTDLSEQRRQILTAEVLRRGGFKATDNAADDMVLEHCSRPLAEKFQVSAEAMRIRLEGMGLLLRKRVAALF